MRGAAGFTMAESLVGLATAVTILVAALAVWDSSRRTLHAGEARTAVQQATRIAFHQLERHLRSAGVGANPDRDPLRPDEGIEATYETAIVVRGDFDADDPDEALRPEQDLAGGAFSWVSTGNDEIVAFALAKPGESSDAIRFLADVADRPRDGSVEEVVIPRVALEPDAPPYTLYRFTLHEDTERWGTASFITRTPVMDDVVSLRFLYFADDGSPVLPAGGGDDLASRSERARIARIRVELVGPTFRLSGDVVPRNRVSGMAGP